MMFVKFDQEIQVELDASHSTAAMQLFSSFRVDGRNENWFGETKGTTAVTLVPEQETENLKTTVVHHLSIYNSDSASKTVTVKIKQQDFTRILFKASLGAGERIEYESGVGFRVFDNTGAIKTV